MGSIRSTLPSFNPRRVNRYVPGLQYAADVQPSGVYRASLGTPAAGTATDILNSSAITNAASTITTFVVDVSDAKFGRALQNLS